VVSPYVFDDDELAFDHEVRTFFASRPDRHRGFFAGRGGATRALYRELGARGWLSLTWPVEWGGGGRSSAYDYLLWNAAAYERAARPDLGPGIIAHVLVAHGTPEQQARHLPGIAAGTSCFSLGYSEPEAGSDLTGLRTRAVLDGSRYVVSGEKCWTSDAHHADHLWLLCRTGTLEERARGLTLLILDLASPGVTVTPIETIDGHRLNQVFLDEVEVDADQRVGAEGAAWGMIREALAIERHLQLLPGRVLRDLHDFVDLMGALGIGDRPDVRAATAELTGQYLQVEAASAHTLAELCAGRPGVVEAATTKLLGTRLAQQIPRRALDLAGPAGLDRSAMPAFLWRQSVMETIAGGTSEVMLSILAREALQLGAR
jgi:alkylation response protein AidB-like acyl-CoA dehydrogenase